MAAKVIQVSDDSGANWHTLPGGSGELNFEGEEINDTIFGATFKSALTGLISWSINANALYKNYAGYLCEIKQQGSSTVMTAEAMTLVSGKTYKITNAAKQIWNRAVTLVVYDNAVDHTADVLSVNYLFGQVTFKSTYTVTTPVTVTGAYFPTVQLGKGQSYTLAMQTEAIDNTDFATAQANGGYRTFTAGLRTVTLELGGVFDATVNSKDDLNDRAELIIEIDPVGTGESIARGFFRLLSSSQSGDVGALEEESLNLTLNVPEENTNPDIGVYFNWVHTSTTLSSALQKVLTAWLTEIPIDVRYLPTGAPGASPLDGVAGDAIVVDVSLSGGLSEMNTFQANFQGTGAYTEV